MRAADELTSISPRLTKYRVAPNLAVEDCEYHLELIGTVAERIVRQLSHSEVRHG